MGREQGKKTTWLKKIDINIKYSQNFKRYFKGFWTKMRKREFIKMAFISSLFFYSVSLWWWGTNSGSHPWETSTVSLNYSSLPYYLLLGLRQGKRWCTWKPRNAGKNNWSWQDPSPEHCPGRSPDSMVNQSPLPPFVPSPSSSLGFGSDFTETPTDIFPYKLLRHLETRKCLLEGRRDHACHAKTKS